MLRHSLMAGVFLCATSAWAAFEGPGRTQYIRAAMKGDCAAGNCRSGT